MPSLTGRVAGELGLAEAIVFGAVAMIAAILQRPRYRSNVAELGHEDAGPGGGEDGPLEPRFLPKNRLGSVGGVHIPPAGAAGLELLAAALQADGAPHGPNIDLRALRGTSPRFRANVVREGKLIFERSRATRIAFEAESMIEWLDFKPIWQQMRAQMLQRWIHG